MAASGKPSIITLRNQQASKMRAKDFIIEYRDKMYQYIKSVVPSWPDYVVKDWLYANFARSNTTGYDSYIQQRPDSPAAQMYRYQYGDRANKQAASGWAGGGAGHQKTRRPVPFAPNTDLKGTLQAKQVAKNFVGPGEENLPQYSWSFDTLAKNIPDILKQEGLSVDTKWTFNPKQQFTWDMWEPKTLDELKKRSGGEIVGHIWSDAERHATQAKLAQQQGGVRSEPVIIAKTSKGYRLLEGWHRTSQHFKSHPQGYVGPAYVAQSTL